MEELQKYWEEIVNSISDIEQHGDAISYIHDLILSDGGELSTLRESNKTLTEERDGLAAERDGLAAERDTLKGALEQAQNEIRSRWTDLTNGGSVTVITNFTKGESKVSSVNDLDFSEMSMNGGTE